MHQHKHGHELKWYQMLTVLISRRRAVVSTTAAVPQNASIVPQNIALPGVNSGRSLRPFTTGLSSCARCIFSALSRSYRVGSLRGVCASRVPSATEKIEALSTVHLHGIHVPLWPAPSPYTGPPSIVGYNCNTAYVNLEGNLLGTW